MSLVPAHDCATTTVASASQAQLRSYQEDGINWLRENPTRGALLADDPGLGKSLQTLVTLDCWGAQRVIVLAPAIARLSWGTQVKLWAPHRLPFMRIIEGQAKPPAAGVLAASPRMFLVLSYDVFSQPKTRAPWMRALCLNEWDALVLDEAHFLKNDRSARTRAIYGEHPGDGTGLEAMCRRVVLLTGTPSPNNAAELWPHYRAFWAKARPDQRPLELYEWQEAYTHYVDGVWGRQIKGSKNQEGLRLQLKDAVLRRRKREVLKELPPVQTEDVPLDATQELTQAVNQAVAKDTPVDDVAALSLARERRLLGEAKAEPAARWADERLQIGDHKLLLFAWHRSVIEQVARFLAEYEPVVVTGQTEQKDRAKAIQLFTHRPQCRVFVGQVLAAGTAITLTAAAHVGIIEPSWVPGENDQAISRAHRMGQTARVLASFLYLPGTLDETIMRSFRRKADEMLGFYHLPGQGSVPTP